MCVYVIHVTTERGSEFVSCEREARPDAMPASARVRLVGVFANETLAQGVMFAAQRALCKARPARYIEKRC